MSEIAGGQGTANDAKVSLEDLQDSVRAKYGQLEADAPKRRLAGAKVKVKRAKAALAEAEAELAQAEKDA